MQMNLDNLKRLASEKAASPKRYDFQMGEIDKVPVLWGFVTNAAYLEEKDRAEKLAQALSKMIEVVEMYEEAFEKMNNNYYHDMDCSYEDDEERCADCRTCISEEALTRANDLIGGI